MPELWLKSKLSIIATDFAEFDSFISPIKLD